MNAAGPWRYDVENAPKDGRDVLGEFVVANQPITMAVRWDVKRLFWGNDCFSLTNKQMLAFAELNLPEVLE